MPLLGGVHARRCRVFLEVAIVILDERNLIITVPDIVVLLPLIQIMQERTTVMRLVLLVAGVLLLEVLVQVAGEVRGGGVVAAGVDVDGLRRLQTPTRRSLMVRLHLPALLLVAARSAATLQHRLRVLLVLAQVVVAGVVVAGAVAGLLGVALVLLNNQRLLLLVILR